MARWNGTVVTNESGISLSLFTGEGLVAKGITKIWQNKPSTDFLREP